MPFISNLTNEFGRRLQDRGWLRAARASYAVAAFLDRNSASAWYNRGLIAKFERRWAESLEYNRRATDLDRQIPGAWWNLGIAATAVGDWETARYAWSGFGISVPNGDGPLEMNLGLVPIRLAPDSRAEVVWTRRIDPARARISSVPLPDSQRGYGDIVLHDGEPRGRRIWQGREVPVFNELQLLEPGGYQTFGVEAIFPIADDFAELTSIAEHAGAAVDDWSSLVPLCAKCSEGLPHDHEEPPESDWVANHQVGLAAKTEHEARAIVNDWMARSSGRELIRFECVFARLET